MDSKVVAQNSKKLLTRCNNINILRFIAACMVIYAHMATLLGLDTPTVMGQDFGGIAVDIFFILSGYLISKSWVRSSSFASYIVRRVARIFPGLAVVVLLTTFVMGPLVTTLKTSEYFTHPMTWKYLLLIALAPIENALPGVFTDNPFPNAVNGSLWTLRYEFLAYLLLPLFYEMGKRFEKRKILVFTVPEILLLIIYVASEVHLVSLPEAIEKFVSLFTYFFAGILVNELHAEHWVDSQVACLALLAMMIFHNEENPLFTVLFPFLLLVFVVGFCFCESARFANIFSKNDLSYGIYIYAFPIQQCVVMFGKEIFNSNVFFSFIISLLITIPFSILSWKFIEKPALSFGRKFH